ncbi:cuscuta receptor 1-like [Hevea brasiliensis]|uniref:cuscuta receptor 1-like n=1 Tax=Hevea brasiliensis TaxID=3981 RepID=UPI0025E5568F|nr:cuscuta receptor 1-like [Hevea brasiliensis]
MPSLKILLLSFCRLNGTIPTAKGLCELKHLQKLDMSNNDLSGTLPLCLANLTSLQLLDLSFNHFIGNISLSPLGSLTSMHTLQLSSNLFRIPISLLPFFNHSKLKHLNCDENEICADIDVPTLTPKFQLRTLDLSGQGDGGVFPKFFYYQHKLEYVDMSNMKMKGEFPHWLIRNNTKLDTLHLPNCSPSGPLQLPIHSHVYFSDLDISDNYFNGSIPTEIGIRFPSLNSLDLSGNGLTGGIPSSFGKMSQLTELDLSSNHLSGIIPQELIVGCSSLSELILSNNSLHGQIFPKQANCEELIRLLLDGNQFNQSIPYSIINCTRLEVLDVRDNHLFGSIPSWIGNMTSLQILDLSKNNFFGNLPSSFCPPSICEVYLSRNRLQGPLMNAFYNCPSLMILDLGHNNFTRRIPEWIGNFSALTYLLLGYNNLEGKIPIQLCNLTQLRLVDLSNNNLFGHVPPCISIDSNWVRGIQDVDDSFRTYIREQPLEFTTKRISYYFRGRVLKHISGLDLSCNNLTGKIPAELGNLSVIQVLNLSHNSLTGLIPQSFSNLKQIESLDLSYNNLNGKIPQLTQLHWLAVFSVAHNNLSGQTPEMVAQFATFDNSSYEGNPFLCGPPLSKSCFASSMPGVSAKDKKDHKRDDGFMDMDAFYKHSILMSELSLCCSFSKLGWLQNTELELIAEYNLLLVFKAQVIGDRVDSGRQGTRPEICAQAIAFWELDSTITESIPTINLSGQGHGGVFPKFLYYQHNLRIPGWIRNVTYLEVLDLSENNFFKNLPSDFGPPWICEVYLSKNRLRGPLMNAFYNCSELTVLHLSHKTQRLELTTKNALRYFQRSILDLISGLDLSCNNLTSKILAEIGNFNIIQLLNLSHNKLTGLIPQSFSNLKQIESLDLSHNNLNGNIPQLLN